jgi:hypothetical protein
MSVAILRWLDGFRAFIAGSQGGTSDAILKCPGQAVHFTHPVSARVYADVGRPVPSACRFPEIPGKCRNGITRCSRHRMPRIKSIRDIRMEDAVVISPNTCGLHRRNGSGRAAWTGGQRSAPDRLVDAVPAPRPVAAKPLADDTWPAGQRGQRHPQDDAAMTALAHASFGSSNEAKFIVLSGA